MSNPVVHVFHHHAMATEFEVRIADQERAYAAQAAQAVFAQADALESVLSRFRASSDISQIAQLRPGGTLRLTEPVFACLQIARTMESLTHGAFSVAPAALKSQAVPPQWSLLSEGCFIRCDRGRLEFDLGAIGKGFALDRMAQTLREWDCGAFLLVAGGSTIVAGDARPGMAGWSCGLGEDGSPHRYWLQNASLSGSGLAVKGRHILDPRTGQTAWRQNRAWALADAGAESDALSTACMVLDDREIAECIQHNPRWLVFLKEGAEWRHIGGRVPPTQA
jgi:thiamine biosynthesis lipoprotein